MPDPLCPCRGRPDAAELAYLTLCRSLQLLALLGRGDASKDLEILVLCHQLSMLRRQVPHPRLEFADRALLAAVSRILPRSRWSCFLGEARDVAGLAPATRHGRMNLPAPRARTWGAQIGARDVVRYPYANFAEALIHERDLAEVIAHALHNLIARP